MMSSVSRGPRRVLSPGEIEARLVAIVKAQQLGGHSPSPEALDRARRMLTGEMIKEQQSLRFWLSAVGETGRRVLSSKRPE